MLPEIHYIRASDKPISPNEVAKHFKDKSRNSIDVSIKRALERKWIKKVDYGLYAHPKYVSPVDARPCPKYHAFEALSLFLLELYKNDNGYMFRDLLSYIATHGCTAEYWKMITFKWNKALTKESVLYIHEYHPETRLSEELRS